MNAKREEKILELFEEGIETGERKIELQLECLPENESFIRICASAYASALDPTLEEIADIKTAVSEAVTNCALHAYAGKNGEILFRAWTEGRAVLFEITDYGCGIGNIELAMQPFYTTAENEERSGMGFTLMQAFMDGVEVYSFPGKGTSVILRKEIGK